MMRCVCFEICYITHTNTHTAVVDDDEDDSERTGREMKGRRRRRRGAARTRAGWWVTLIVGSAHDRTTCRPVKNHPPIIASPAAAWKRIRIVVIKQIVSINQQNNNHITANTYKLIKT